MGVLPAGRRARRGRPSPSGAVSPSPPPAAAVGLLRNGRAGGEGTRAHTHTHLAHRSAAVPLGRGGGGGGGGTKVLKPLGCRAVWGAGGVRGPLSAPRPLPGQGWRAGRKRPHTHPDRQTDRTDTLPSPRAGSRSPAALTQGLGSGE